MNHQIKKTTLLKTNFKKIIENFDVNDRNSFGAIPLLSIPFVKSNNMQYIFNTAVMKSRSEV